MRVIVIGASRGIGRQTVKAALAKGYRVTAFARNPAALGIQDPHLRLQAGDVLDTSSLRKAIASHDVVICTLGLPTRQAIGLPFAKRSYVLSTGTKNILDAMQQKHIKRFICVTAIGAGDSVSQCTLEARLSLRYGLRWLFKEKDAQEQLIKSSSGVEWTIIRPTALTDGRKKGALAEGKAHFGILSHISRADVAAAMLEMIDQKTSYHQARILSYPPRFGDSARWIVGYLGAN